MKKLLFIFAFIATVFTANAAIDSVQGINSAVEDDCWCHTIEMHEYLYSYESMGITYEVYNIYTITTCFGCR